MNSKQIISKISEGGFDKAFTKLYGESGIAAAKERYISAVNNFVSLYGDNDGLQLFSVGGRTEIMGNHTDHNLGEVIASSVGRDIIAVACEYNDNLACVKSADHAEDVADLTNLKPSPDRYFGSAELVRGMCALMKEAGYTVKSFRAFTESRVPGGSGLSSSAAYEVMLGNIINYLFNDGKVSNVEIAKFSQKAENIFFGKPCGLMDQMACAVGGMIHIDFADAENPIITKIDSSAVSDNYKLCIMYPGGSHSDLNEEYAAVPSEMKAIASYFGKKVLRELTLGDIMNNLSALRNSFGDRAVMRAIHFFNENERVKIASSALSKGDVDTFFNCIVKSGDSSFKYLQNVYTTRNIKSQGLSLAYAVSDSFGMKKTIYTRVHGGGFAGTVLSFVRNEDVNEFADLVNKCFGPDSCMILDLRNYGAVSIYKENN